MMSEGSVSILLLDEHADLRDRLECWLKTKPGIDVVGSISDPLELSQLLDSVRVDVVIMGLVFSDANGLGLIADCSKRHPEAGLLVMSHLPEESYAQRVLNAGARGYLMKTVTPARLLAAARKVAMGEVAVSPRMASRLSLGGSNRPIGHHRYSKLEFVVWRLIKQGRSNAAIAEEVCVSEGEVVMLKRCIATKLSLHLRICTLSLRSHLVASYDSDF